MDPEALLRFAVDRREMRPTVGRNRPGHHRLLLHGRTVDRHPHDRAIVGEPDHEDIVHPVDVTVGRQRAGLARIARLDPSLDRPAHIRADAGSGILGILLSADRRSGRHHRAVRHRYPGDIPPGGRIAHPRRRHRLRTKLDILLSGPTLVDQNPDGGSRVPGVAVVVHPGLVDAGNRIGLLERDVLGAHSRNVVDVQECAGDRRSGLPGRPDDQVGARRKAHVAAKRIDQPGVEIARAVPHLRDADIGAREGAGDGDRGAADAAFLIHRDHHNLVDAGPDDAGVVELIERVQGQADHEIAVHVEAGG